MKFEADRSKRVLLTSIIAVVFFCAHGQSLKDYVQKGDRHFQRMDYKNALRNYVSALSMSEGDDAQVYFKAGISCLNEELYGEAIEYLQKAFQLQPDVDPQIHYQLATAYQANHQFQKAREQYEAFRSRYENLTAVANQKIAECILADSLMRIPSHAEVHPLTDLNTPFTELFPLLSADGSTLLFTSDRSASEYQIKSGTNFSDVYVARKEGDRWGAATKLSAKINVKLTDVAVSRSRDGKTLFLYYEEGHGDIYTSSLENGDWSAPIPLNRFVNHPHYREMGACLSPDGQKLYFSSNRPGGKGGYDIYVCERTTGGDWGRPSNLGSVINTRGDEESPFLQDGETLYFSSNGHPSIGNHDIYRTSLQGTRWSAPEHLGYPINTGGYESNFTLSEDGTVGYFSSERGKASGIDLYVAHFLPAPSQVETTASPDTAVDRVTPEERKIATVLKGTVVDAKSGAPLDATVRLMDQVNKIVISTTRTGPSGTFELVIPKGGNFRVVSEKPGYLFNSVNFDLPDFEKYQEIETHILMVKAEVGSKVVLKNIFFDVNEATLKPESLSELENLHDLLVQNPEWRIQINGHTDNVGDPKANMALSLKRAQSVVDYLIKAGISPERLQARGFGSERPLVSNDDEKEGRQINRRTEIEIID